MYPCIHNTLFSPIVHLVYMFCCFLTCCFLTRPLVVLFILSFCSTLKHSHLLSHSRAFPPQVDQSAFAPQKDFVAYLTAAMDQQNDTRYNSTFLANDPATGAGNATGTRAGTGTASINGSGPLSVAVGGGGGREQGSTGKLSPSQMESVLTPPSKSPPGAASPTSPAPEKKARRPSLIPSPTGGKHSPSGGGKSRETSPSTSPGGQDSTQDDRKTPSKWHTREVL